MSTVRQITVDIGGKQYVLASDDVYLHHFSNGFEPLMVDLFRTLADPSEVILDVGANVGCTALLFAGMAQQVYAFEPSTSTFRFLQQNIDRSGLGNIRVLNYGLGAQAAETTITFSPTNRSGGFVSDQTQANAGHTVETIKIRTLDEVSAELNLPKINFIKVDVEGYEGQVLRGAGETLKKHRPVVTLEMNHWCLNAFQRTSIPDYMDHLRSVFPIVLAVDGHTYMDLHDKADSYGVMYSHILQNRYCNVVGAFDESQVKTFKQRYRHQLLANPPAPLPAGRSSFPRRVWRRLKRMVGG